MIGFAKQVYVTVCQDVDFYAEYVSIMGNKSGKKFEKKFEEILHNSVETVMNARSVGNEDYEGDVYEVIFNEFSEEVYNNKLAMEVGY